MFVLSQKLKVLKLKLKNWNKTTFGNIHNLVRNAENILVNIQNEIESNGNNEALMEQQKLAQIQLEKALQKEEDLWREKANV